METEQQLPVDPESMFTSREHCHNMFIGPAVACEGTPLDVPIIETNLELVSQAINIPDVCALHGMSNCISEEDGMTVQKDCSWYYCNFCTFASEDGRCVRQHLWEHLFHCTCCSFTGFSRLAVALHYKSSHQKSIAGFNDVFICISSSLRKCKLKKRKVDDSYPEDVQQASNNADDLSDGILPENTTEPDCKKAKYDQNILDTVVNEQLAKGKLITNDCLLDVQIATVNEKEPSDEMLPVERIDTDCEKAKHEESIQDSEVSKQIPIDRLNNDDCLLDVQIATVNEKVPSDGILFPEDSIEPDDEKAKHEQNMDLLVMEKIPKNERNPKVILTKLTEEQLTNLKSVEDEGAGEQPCDTVMATVYIHDTEVPEEEVQCDAAEQLVICGDEKSEIAGEIDGNQSLEIEDNCNRKDSENVDLSNTSKATEDANMAVADKVDTVGKIISPDSDCMRNSANVSRNKPGMSSTMIDNRDAVTTIEGSLQWSCPYCAFATSLEEDIPDHIALNHHGRKVRYVITVGKMSDKTGAQSNCSTKRYSQSSLVQSATQNIPTYTEVAQNDGNCVGGLNTLYKCPHCGFNSLLINEVKEHVLKKHTGMMMFALDMGAETKRNMWFCLKKECEFYTREGKDFLQHSSVCTPWSFTTLGPDSIMACKVNSLLATKEFLHRNSKDEERPKQNFKSSITFCCTHCSYMRHGSIGNDTTVRNETKMHVQTEHMSPKKDMTVQVFVNDKSIETYKLFFCHRCLWDTREVTELVTHVMLNHTTNATDSSGIKFHESQVTVPQVELMAGEISLTEYTKLVDLSELYSMLHYFITKELTPKPNMALGQCIKMGLSGIELYIKQRERRNPKLYRCLSCTKCIFGALSYKNHIDQSHAWAPYQGIDVLEKSKNSQLECMASFCPNSDCDFTSFDVEDVKSHATRLHKCKDDDKELLKFAAVNSKKTSIWNEKIRRYEKHSNSIVTSFKEVQHKSSSTEPSSSMDNQQPNATVQSQKTKQPTTTDLSKNTQKPIVLIQNTQQPSNSVQLQNIPQSTTSFLSENTQQPTTSVQSKNSQQLSNIVHSQIDKSISVSSLNTSQSTKTDDSHASGLKTSTAVNIQVSSIMASQEQIPTPTLTASRSQTALLGNVQNIPTVSAEKVPQPIGKSNGIGLRKQAQKSREALAKTVSQSANIASGVQILPSSSILISNSEPILVQVPKSNAAPVVEVQAPITNLAVVPTSNAVSRIQVAVSESNVVPATQFAVSTINAVPNVQGSVFTNNAVPIVQVPVSTNDAVPIVQVPVSTINVVPTLQIPKSTTINPVIQNLRLGRCSVPQQANALQSMYAVAPTGKVAKITFLPINSPVKLTKELLSSYLSKKSTTTSISTGNTSSGPTSQVMTSTTVLTLGNPSIQSVNASTVMGNGPGRIQSVAPLLPGNPGAVLSQIGTPSVAMHNTQGSNQATKAILDSYIKPEAVVFPPQATSSVTSAGAQQDIKSEPEPEPQLEVNSAHTVDIEVDEKYVPVLNQFEAIPESTEGVHQLDIKPYSFVLPEPVICCSVAVTGVNQTEVTVKTEPACTETDTGAAVNVLRPENLIVNANFPGDQVLRNARLPVQYQCIHCTEKSLILHSLPEMKTHLLSCHRNSVFVFRDIVAQKMQLPSEIYVCPVIDCDFGTKTEEVYHEHVKNKCC